MIVAAMAEVIIVCPTYFGDLFKLSIENGYYFHESGEKNIQLVRETRADLHNVYRELVQFK